MSRKPNLRDMPLWCKKRFHVDLFYDNNVCCNCGEYPIYYQEGDGKVLHSLCKNCHKILKKELEK